MNPHSAASVIQATDPEMPDLARILESGYQAPDSLGKHGGFRVLPGNGIRTYTVEQLLGSMKACQLSL